MTRKRKPKKTKSPRTLGAPKKSVGLSQQGPNVSAGGIIMLAEADARRIAKAFSLPQYQRRS